ncbi:MAG: DUF6118 family protein [Pseudomonadota bacterium]
MSLQPSDPAADAFERLRLEVALLRRAIEGLAADAGGDPVDYSPTLAELSGAVADVDAKLGALGERPALALTPEQIGALLHQGTARLLAKPLAELERERAVLGQTTEALRAARQAELARARSWRRLTGFTGAGAGLGVLLAALLTGPLARTLPSGWGVPERLAAATLAESEVSAGDRLLRRSDPSGWQRLQRVRALPEPAWRDFDRCAARESGPATCTLKLRRD